MRHGDLFGRILGILVFLGGVALLVLVFKDAHTMFTSDSMGLQAGAAGKPAVGATNQLGASAVRMFAGLGLLLLMMIAGSLVANKGINLYFASHAAKKSVDVRPEQNG
jgi:hypothetical protein